MTPALGRPPGPPTPAPDEADRPAPAIPTDRVVRAPSFPPPRPPRDVRATGARMWRRSWPWLAAVAAVVLVVATELALLRGRIEADLARLHAAGGAPTTTVAAPALPPVPVIAPPAAGDVDAVRLRVVDPPCDPGGACSVLVGIDPHPGAAAVASPWTLVVADRCRGGVVPLGSGTSPAGAWGTTTVVVPPGRALALLAVTDAPSRAASAPVPIGAGPC
ncbi:hypothetical protein [Actinomycetospora cinnamomea]|uniref:Anti-sigma-K factor rskA n=1 Tax=Actinomycetospora cinnamomea TaxID=663609 RepID=A0A2U1FD35_9PSEU|nr:hypothetical protein [Actinomycetospora cinnamomea]PVZ10049.1 hypothetical protein C8D89_105125 [Actinomycetospora cinnamomea]